MATNLLYPLICSLYVIFLFPFLYFNGLNKNKIASMIFLLVPVFITTATQVNIGTDYTSYIYLYTGHHTFDINNGVMFYFLFKILNFFS